MQNHPICTIFGASLCLALTFAQRALSEPALDSKSAKEIIVTQAAPAENWWVEGGPLYRGDMQIGFAGSSYSQQSSIGASTALPAGIGSQTGYADRTYTDGYVKRDPGTGKSRSLDPNGTWYWGYDNASQHNGTAQTLSFHASGTPGYVQDYNNQLSGKDHADGVGFEIAVGRTLVETGKLKLDFAAGFEAAWGLQSHLDTSTFGATWSRIDVADTYNLGGITVPAAGYRGTYLGPFNNPPTIPSAVISDTPSSRQVSVTGLGYSVANAIKLNATTDTYEFWFGPRLSVQAISWLSFYVNPRIGGAFADMDGDRTETLIATASNGGKNTLRTWHDTANNGAWALMGGVTAGANIQVTRRVFVDIHGGYEWASNNINLQIGPNSLTLNPSGCTAGVSVGVKF